MVVPFGPNARVIRTFRDGPGRPAGRDRPAGTVPPNSQTQSDRGNRTRDTKMTAIELQDPVTGPTAERPHRPHVGHVLLATDLREASSRATEQAITLAARDNAVLQILAVAKTHDERVGMEQRIQLVRRRARASGVRATSIVWSGDPVRRHPRGGLDRTARCRRRRRTAQSMAGPPARQRLRQGGARGPLPRRDRAELIVARHSATSFSRSRSRALCRSRT